jgi:hypothetical protein
MEEVFTSLPSNVAVVWPESKISSYNLAEFAEVALVSWSSIALEMARFGVPVVASFERLGQFPSGTFVAFADTVEGYFEGVRKAIEQPARLSGIVEAFRWTYFLHWTPLLDVSDLIPTSNYNDVPVYRTPRNRDEILEVVEGGIDLVQTKMRRLARTDEAYAAEHLAILAAIRRFVYFLVVGKDFAAGSASRVDWDKIGLFMEPDGATIVTDGESKRRSSSVLVRRLALICEAGNDFGSLQMHLGEGPETMMAQGDA